MWKGAVWVGMPFQTPTAEQRVLLAALGYLPSAIVAHPPARSGHIPLAVGHIALT